jgi:hypothetical protein
MLAIRLGRGSVTGTGSLTRTALELLYLATPAALPQHCSLHEAVSVYHQLQAALHRHALPSLQLNPHSNSIVSASTVAKNALTFDALTHHDEPS